jgi:5-methylcytosine-specific restriction endonuclease McrA
MKKNKFNLRTRLVDAIRKTWLRSPMRYEIVKAAREAPGLYRCHNCRALVKIKELQIDHVNPVREAVRAREIAVDWNSYIAEMFFGKMQPLCKPCHKTKTITQRSKTSRA